MMASLEENEVNSLGCCALECKLFFVQNADKEAELAAVKEEMAAVKAENDRLTAYLAAARSSAASLEQEVWRLLLLFTTGLLQGGLEVNVLTDKKQFFSNQMNF